MKKDKEMYNNEFLCYKRLCSRVENCCFVLGACLMCKEQLLFILQGEELFSISETVLC